MGNNHDLSIFEKKICVPLSNPALNRAPSGRWTPLKRRRLALR